MNHQLAETISAVSTKASIATAVGTTVGGLTVEEWSILGVIVGIAGTCIMVGFTIWFRLKYQRGDRNE